MSLRRAVLVQAIALAGCHYLLPFTAGEQRLDHPPPSELRVDAPREPDLEPCTPTVFTTGMSASVVIGQADFADTRPNRGGAIGADTLQRPLGVAIARGKLYIADGLNNRVLVFNRPPTRNGASADLAIGQPDLFTTSDVVSTSTFRYPQGIHVDDQSLVVSEWENSRVSFWRLADLQQAVVFWGQPDGLTGAANTDGVTGRSLNNTAFVLRAGGYYVVTDANNNRALLFDPQPSTHQAAVAVIGQPDASSSAAGAGPGQLHFPLGAASDGTRLVIVDGYNNRLVFFNKIPTSDSPTPDLVWGGVEGVSATLLRNPVGALYDGTRLLVSDRGNSRVLVFDSWPTTKDQPASVVLGQATFTEGTRNRCGCDTAAADTLHDPHFMFWDGCRLYLADSENNRVLVY